MLEGEPQDTETVDTEVTEQRPNGGGDEGDASGSHDSSSSRRYAKMPVDRNALYYNMNHKHRGMAIIFNHEHFEIHSLKSRTGTNIDSYNLSKVLKGLGFRVTPLHNLTSEKIMTYLQDTANMDHSNHDCLLIVVLTHGELNKLYAKDTHYKPEKLWSYFTGDKCLTLAGKPKLFFIQACRGHQLDDGITLLHTETDGSPFTSYKIPVQADFLIVFSTVPGYYSWKEHRTGSWFIQALCEELLYAGKERDKRDILTLLTFVNQRVALDYETYKPEVMTMHKQKQIPCITSMLTRLLVFGTKSMS